MKNILLLAVITASIAILTWNFFHSSEPAKLKPAPKKEYWLMLLRQSNKEYLYHGIPGDIKSSTLVRSFSVKTGIPGERPTPLPKLTGRKYWLITDKEESFDNEETAPFFLTLNIPGIDTEPFGPTPYLECNGQCNWQLPGKFGLHGVNNDLTRLSEENAGSSGCIRHTNEDITYLYNLLDPKKAPIRYYIQDI